MRPPIRLRQQSSTGIKVAAERPPRGTVQRNVGQRGEQAIEVCAIDVCGELTAFVVQSFSKPPDVIVCWIAAVADLVQPMCECT